MLALLTLLTVKFRSMADPSSNLNSYDNQFGTLEVGSFIGGTYRVLDFIGQGGMGFVYKVEHIMMAKVLALKILRSEQVSEEVWKRFRIEAQAIARLDHANVVRIYDMSQTEAGLPFYTMDLLVGESLADYLDEYYRLPVSEALPIFRQVCAGLAYAHDRGIIHRDIKPGNIMLLADGRVNSLSKVAPVVKIVDFGIAKLSSFDSSFGQGLTRPGEVFGSPLYMSPEQCSGQKLDHRTDMYSVGVTMFQALTGRPPLLGKTAVETTAMHQSVVPPAMADAIVLEEDEEPIVFPPELEEIVARLLEKSPDARYDSLADVASELLALERGEVRKRQGGTASADGGRLAPYAVAEAARRKAGYSKTQVLTSGQSETDSGADAVSRKQTRSLVLALLGVIVLMGVLASAACVISLEVQKKKTASVFIKPVGSFAASSMIDALKQYDSDNIETATGLLPAKDEQIRRYLNTHVGFYSKPIAQNGKESYVFEFPNDFSLGQLAHWTATAPYSTREPAQGKVEMPKREALRLSADPALCAHPSLLKFFRSDELVEVCINDKKDRSPELFPNLQRLSKLSRLDLKSTLLQADDLASLDRLDSLRELCLDNSGLSGATLARCRILPRLKVIGLSGLSDLTPVLRKLAESNNLERLEINGSNLTKQDCVYISRMTKLRNLLLSNNPITDGDLEQLTSLKNLTVLDSRNCNKLTPKSIDSFAKFKNLEELLVNVPLVNPDNEKKLKKALPKLVNFNF